LQRNQILISGQQKINMMITRTVSTLIFAASLISAATTATAATLAEKLSSSSITMNITVKGCKDDAQSLCPGLSNNSRKLFMCLAAYEDSLSDNCKLGIAEAAMTLEKGMMAIDYSIRACQLDADTHCLDVEAGEGRIVGCLKKNEALLAPQCATALKETGLWNLGAE
jgi:hypothetical protein